MSFLSARNVQTFVRRDDQALLVREPMQTLNELERCDENYTEGAESAAHLGEDVRAPA